jgi:hypothetical protein
MISLLIPTPCHAMLVQTDHHTATEHHHMITVFGDWGRPAQGCHWTKLSHKDWLALCLCPPQSRIYVPHYCQEMAVVADLRSLTASIILSRLSFVGVRGKQGLLKSKCFLYSLQMSTSPLPVGLLPQCIRMADFGAQLLWVWALTVWDMESSLFCPR